MALGKQLKDLYFKGFYNIALNKWMRRNISKTYQITGYIDKTYKESALTHCVPDVVQNNLKEYFHLQNSCKIIEFLKIF